MPEPIAMSSTVVVDGSEFEVRLDFLFQKKS